MATAACPVQAFLPADRPTLHCQPEGFVHVVLRAVSSISTRVAVVHWNCENSAWFGCHVYRIADRNETRRIRGAIRLVDGSSVVAGR